MSDRQIPAEQLEAARDLIEKVREQVIDLAAAAEGFSEMDKLPQNVQLGCVVKGVMAGVIGYAFEWVQPEYRDTMVEEIKKLFPDAEECARAIVENDELTTSQKQ